MKKAIILIGIMTSLESIYGQTNTFPSTGSVGIGTITPVSKLHIEGNATTNTIGTEDLLTIGRGLTPGTSFQQAASFKLGRWAEAGSIYESFTRMDIALKNNAAASNYNTDVTVMTLQNNGYIGIGAIAPQEPLHIVGANVHGIRLESTSNSAILDFYNNGVNHNYRISPYNGDGLEVLASASLGTTPSATSIMFMKYNGNVGIGTVAPSEKLSVIGNAIVDGAITTKKVTVTQTGWPDYVFHPSYKLKSLSEVAQFIQQNQRLPELPSAKDVEEKGINLGDNQTLLLKKIEELTLYVIALKKESELQQKQITELQKTRK